MNGSLPLALGIGILFGLVLERSGLGDARRLAAQFYLTEMRVLRVMFTAIATCLVLLALGSSLRLIDLGELAIPSTFVPTAVLGGLLLGVGFVVAGYCPGTSIVAAATGKADGLFAVLGVALGSLAFDGSASSFRTTWDTAGALGRLTLPEALGLPFGVVVAGVVVLAAAMFGAATYLEGHRPRRRAIPAAAVGALALLLAVAIRPAAGEGASEERTLASRTVHVDPVEVLGLMHGEIGGAPARFGLVIVDVRPESDFNRFHLAGAVRQTLDDLRGAGGAALTGPRHAMSIVVLVSNDERAAEDAWRILRAQGNRHAYVLAGGVNLWLDLLREGPMRHAFDASLGERYRFAKPSVAEYRALWRTRAVTPHVRPVVKTARAVGGCG